MCEHKQEFEEIRNEMKNLKVDSEKTMKMFQSVSNDYSDLMEANKKLHHVLFGDKETKQLGMVDKVDDIYTLIIQKNGLLGLLKFMTLFGTITGMMYLFFKKIP